MYRDLGFIRVSGRLARKGRGSTGQQLRDELDSVADAGAGTAEAYPLDESGTGGDEGTGRDGGERGLPGDRRVSGEPGHAGQRGIAEPAPYAYLIYPHKPIVAYVPKTGRLLSEYCVEFPDLTGAISQTRLPDSDDVLAKWMALTGDEERLIRNANMHLPGRQVDPSRVRRDLWRLSEWERQRRGYGPVRAPRT
jgi:hypothetical protein